MKIAAIIPARMASSRLPGKPLAKIAGLSMIEHVRRRVLLCNAVEEVVVATCDEEIRREVEGFGGRVIMTSDKHERCTDRVAEAARTISADIILNVQGDVPMIDPGALDTLIAPFNDNNVLCVDLIAPISSKEEFESPNVVKIVVDNKGNSLYYSREPIPSSKKASGDHEKFKQLGIIGFRKGFLLQFSDLSPTPLEQTESVDMLRAVEHGFKIKTAITLSDIRGVDTAEDMKRAEARLGSDPLLKKYMKAGRVDK